MQIFDPPPTPLTRTNQRTSPQDHTRGGGVPPPPSRKNLVAVCRARRVLWLHIMFSRSSILLALLFLAVPALRAQVKQADRVATRPELTTPVRLAGHLPRWANP